MSEFFKFVGVAVASAAALASIVGFVISQLVKRDEIKIEHNRRSTDTAVEHERAHAEAESERVHAGATR